MVTAAGADEWFALRRGREVPGVAGKVMRRLKICTGLFTSCSQR